MREKSVFTLPRNHSPTPLFDHSPAPSQARNGKKRGVDGRVGEWSKTLENIQKTTKKSLYKIKKIYSQNRRKNSKNRSTKLNKPH